MLSCRKPPAAVAAVIAALGVAIPVASANAAARTVDPQVCQLFTSAMRTHVTGAASLAHVLANARATVKCPGTGAQQPPPTGP